MLIFGDGSAPPRVRTIAMNGRVTRLINYLAYGLVAAFERAQPL